MKRRTTLLAATDIGTAGTKVIELALKEAISALYIVWEFTIVTVSVMTNHPLACLSKIEVVDGSEVLFSASGRAAQALAYYGSGIMPRNQYSLTVGGICRSVVPIYFGRALWDSLFALRPDVFDNPQIRITFDEDAANGSVVVNALAVYADIDDSPTGGHANGYMLSREHKSYAMAASSHEYTQLPTDYPLRAMFLQALSADHDTGTLLANVKVDIENGKVIPLDQPADDLIHTIVSRYGRVSERHVLDAVVTAKTIYPACTEDGEIQIQYDDTDFVTAQSNFAVPTFTGEKLALAASVDIQGDSALISGVLPHGVIPVWFGDPSEPDTWLPVSSINNIRADVQSSSDADSGDTATILTQQPIMYGQR